MNPNQEVTSLRKAGRLDEAYSRGYELYKEYPEDRLLANSIGWILYDKVKKLVAEVNQSQATATEARKNELYKILREYADLKLPRPDLLFSLLFSQTLRFPKELDFLPGFMKWAGLDCFQPEDYNTGLGKDNKVFESLVEKAAREVGKVARNLNDRPDLQEFAIALINKTLDLARVQQPEWLHYNKALLLKQLGRLEEAQKLLVSVVKEKRHDFWAWRALANVLEGSDPTLALALYSKACLTCKDAKFGVSTYEDLSKLAAKEGKFALAKWAADRALTVRQENEWSLPPSLRELLNANWYLQAETLANAEELLVELAADAQKVVWANCPRRDANYLGTFTTQKGKRMVKFGLFVGNCCEEVPSPMVGLLNNLNLIVGEPVTATVDDSGDLLTVVIVEKRQSGTLFDKLDRVYGVVDYHHQRNALIYLNPQQHCKLSYAEFPTIKEMSPGTAIEIVCAKTRDRINPYQFSLSPFQENQNIRRQFGVLHLHQDGYGFVGDTFVSPSIASQLKDEEEIELIVVRKLNKKNHKMGWSAIALESQIQN